MGHDVRMHDNARRVLDAAGALGLEIDIIEYPDGTRTAEEAAAAVGAPVAAIVKSLVFLVDDQPVMALVAGHNRLDEARLLGATGGQHVGRADADLVRSATGYPIGGVPPFGHATPLRTFVDEDLLTQAEVWAAAGTPRHVFRLTPSELVAASGADVVPLAT